MKWINIYRSFYENLLNLDEHEDENRPDFYENRSDFVEHRSDFDEHRPDFYENRSDL